MTGRQGPKVSIVLSCRGCDLLDHHTACGCLVAKCSHSSAPKDNWQTSLLTPEWPEDLRLQQMPEVCRAE